jgi:hypothetical protein
VGVMGRMMRAAADARRRAGIRRASISDWNIIYEHRVPLKTKFALIRTGLLAFPMLRCMLQELLVPHGKGDDGIRLIIIIMIHFWHAHSSRQ